MFDLKVITAVFVTLLGIAVGMSQGAVDKGEINDISTLLKDISETPRKLLDMFKSGTQLNASIDLEVVLEDIPEFKKEYSRSLSSIRFMYYPGSSIRINDADFSSKNKAPISISNFKGSIDIGEELSMKGSGKRAELGDYIFNSSSIRVEAEKITRASYEVRGMPATTFSFDDAKGSIKLSKSDISLKNESLKVVGFKGDMKIDFENREFVLDGKSAEIFVGGEEVSIKISD